MTIAKIINNEYNTKYPKIENNLISISSKTVDELLISDKITDRQGIIIKILNKLSNDQRRQALKLINKFKHLFTSDPLDIGCANVGPCKINLKSEKPIFQPHLTAITELKKNFEKFNW